MSRRYDDECLTVVAVLCLIGGIACVAIVMGELIKGVLP